MKASKASIGRSLDAPNADIRFYLFHGPDEAQSRALAARLLEALGAGKLMLAQGTVKSEPAALVDEAAALSLFGGKRAIWIEPAGNDLEEAARMLLEGPAPESPAIAVAGTLGRSSGLLKLAEAAPAALSFGSYIPEGQDAQRMISDVGRRYGLKISPPVAARLADGCGGDQAIAAQELQKLALYVGADPHSPRELDHDAVDAVGAESASGNFLRLADLALSGQVAQLSEELSRLPPGGGEAIPVVRSLQRRLLLLAPARARVEQGESPEAVMTSLGKTLFWKDKALIERMVRQWNAEGLARVAERAGKLEREFIFSDAPPREALGEELLAIARKARAWA